MVSGTLEAAGAVKEGSFMWPSPPNRVVVGLEASPSSSKGVAIGSSNGVAIGRDTSQSSDGIFHNVEHKRECTVHFHDVGLGCQASLPSSNRFGFGREASQSSRAYTERGSNVSPKESSTSPAALSTARAISKAGGATLDVLNLFPKKTAVFSFNQCKSCLFWIEPNLRLPESVVN